ncbi:MAG: hypothetical protein EOM19_08590 [Candidatus Moranbacteria bacterium]|nr:hypothetical protein [Candidatus Moranbacteria bacterium]
MNDTPKSVGLHLNKKGTKVQIDTSYQFLGTSALLTQYGIPFIYIATVYDLFEPNGKYSLTGWGIVGIALIFLALRQKIKEAIKEFDMHLSVTAQRSKWALTSFTIAGILAVSQIFFTAFLQLFLVIGISTILSLPLWSPYDNIMEERNEVQKMLKDDLTKAKAEKLKAKAVAMREQNNKKNSVSL